MRWILQFLFAFFALLVTTSPGLGERLTPEKLWDLARIGDAAVSPDGTLLAYLLKRYDLQENKGTTSLILQSLPDGEIQTSGKRSTAFDTPLAAPKAKTVLADVEGLGSLGWLDHSSGPKLVYVAPAEVDKDEKDKAGDEDQDDDEKEEDERKPQAWMLDPQRRRSESC